MIRGVIRLSGYAHSKSPQSTVQGFTRHDRQGHPGDFRRSPERPVFNLEMVHFHYVPRLRMTPEPGVIRSIREFACD